jgi:hypothetical protein
MLSRPNSFDQQITAEVVDDTLRTEFDCTRRHVRTCVYTQLQVDS